jgi:hypothetical protein
MAFGLVTLGMGLLARLGIWRWGWVSQYRNSELPWYIRNGAFGQLPAGVAFLLFIPLFVCAGRASCIAPARGTTILAIGLLFFAGVVMAHPPGWAKPAWLIEAEQNDWQGFVEYSTRARLTAYAATVVIMSGTFVLLVTGRLVFSLPFLLIGVGFGLQHWAARRGAGRSK